MRRVRSSCEVGVLWRASSVISKGSRWTRRIGFRGNSKWFMWKIWWHSRNSEVIGSIRNFKARPTASSHWNFADGITPGVFGPQQRQARHRASMLPPPIGLLQHLRSCLRDAALETIRSLEISDGNYAIALDLPQYWVDNRRLGFQAHITEILGLKAVQSGSVSTLRELSDKFNADTRALKRLGTTE